MSNETDANGRIGPQLSLADVSIPPAVGEAFGALYGTAAPATGAEWVTAMGETVERVEGRRPTVADLCTAPDGEHVFVPDDAEDDGTGERAYRCPLDPLVYPFLTGTTGTVRSPVPGGESVVTVEIGTDGVAVSHDEAVVSLGVARGLDDAEPTLATVYRDVCGYVRAFPDRAAYERWAADADAATMALPVREGVALARELAAALFADGEATRDETAGAAEYDECGPECGCAE